MKPRRKRQRSCVDCGTEFYTSARRKVRCRMCQHRRELNQPYVQDAFVERYVWVNENWHEHRPQVVRAEHDICLEAAIDGKLHHEDTLDLFGYPKQLPPEDDPGLRRLIATVLAQQLPPKGARMNVEPGAAHSSHSEAYHKAYNSTYYQAVTTLRELYPEQYESFVDYNVKAPDRYLQARRALRDAHKEEFRSILAWERELMRQGGE